MIVAVYSVFCDECNNWTAQAESVKEARAEAKAARWVRVRRDGRMADLCPVCGGVPCEIGRFSECTVHGSYVTDHSHTADHLPKCEAVCRFEREKEGER